MKHIKHWLATVAMLLCSISMSAKLTWEITAEKELIIEGTGAIADYKPSFGHETEASWGNYDIKKVTIKSGVTSIGAYAFSGMESIVEVSLPEGLTSIGEGAFYWCKSLTTVNIPKTVTAIGDYAFNYCKLTSLSLPNTLSKIGKSVFPGNQFTTLVIPEGVTHIGYNTFCDCSLLETVVLPNSVTEIAKDAFYYCKKLQQIEFGNGLTTIGDNAFAACEKLEELVIPNSVTSIGEYAFDGCTGLKRTIIPGSVTNLGQYAFNNCTGELILNCNFSLVTSESYALFKYSAFEKITIEGGWRGYIDEKAFYQFESLTSLIIGKGITSIGENAFAGCSNLASVTIGEDVEYISESAFFNCHSLNTITCHATNPPLLGSNVFYNVDESIPVYVPMALCSAYKKAYGWKEFTNIKAKGCIGFGTFDNNLTWKLTDEGELIIEGTGNMKNSSFTEYPWHEHRASIKKVTICDGVTSIGTYAFCDCSNIISITIPESVTSIESYAFSYCSSLTAITIPESVTSIGYNAFCECSSLTAVHISDIAAWCNIKFSYSDSNPLNSAKNLYLNGKLVTELTIPEGVTSIGSYAFCGCESLTTITILENSQLTSIGMGAFYCCSSLTAITIPEGVTSIGSDAFCGCESLTTITIPEGVTSIGEYAFCDCSNLTTVTIPEGVTSIGWNAFRACSSLTAITIPESVTSIEGWAFSYCSSLTTITIPKSVTSIGVKAFRACSSLTTITILENSQLTSIGMGAFENCHSLTTIICRAMIPPTIDPSGTFYNVDKSIPVYVSASSLSSYKTAAGWNEFTNIQAIPEFITLNQYGSGTYCSEYALDFSEVEGLKAYAATGYNTKTGIVTLTRVMTSKPGLGLFIKGEPGEYTVPVLEDTDDNSLNMFVGLTENTTITATSSDGLYCNFRYTIKPGEEAPLFYRVEEAGFTLGAGKAYLQIPAAWMPATEARSIGLRFDDEDTTDIEETEFTIQDSEFIFDLMGRRVDQPQKGSMYIVNGKKTIIK